MKPHVRLSNALWSAAETDAHFEVVLQKLTALQLQIPDKFDGNIIEILDELQAARGYLKAVTYDLKILIRTSKNSVLTTAQNSKR